MLFRPELAELVIEGQKTQTRRLAHPGDTERHDSERNIQEVVAVSGRIRWRVGTRYAVQPGRGKRGLGHIMVESIAYEPDGVADISEAEAVAEGFSSVAEFHAAWDRINGACARTCACYMLTIRSEKKT